MGMKKIASVFNRGFDFIIAANATITGALAIILMVIVTFDVFMGYFFNNPTHWVSEISSYILVFIPFLAGAWILKHDRHVKMDFLVGRLSEKNKSILSIILYIIEAGICCIIIWYSTKSVIHHYKINFLTPTVLMLPKWPLLAVIPFGFILIFLQTLRGAYSKAIQLKALR